MAQRSHGCSSTVNVDLVDMELITNVAAATKLFRERSKALPIIISSYILGVVEVKMPYFSFVSQFGRHCWQNELSPALAMLWAESVLNGKLGHAT